MVDRRLDVRIQTRLPAALTAGSATAVFLHGSCFHLDQGVDRVEVMVGGEVYPVTAQGMPLFDLYRQLCPPGPDGWSKGVPAKADDPNARSYLSGFWATAPVRMPLDGEAVAVVIRALLADGSVSEAPIGTIEVTTEPRPAADARVVIAMATHEPDPGLFAVQIESLRAQTFEDWLCVISDDASSAERLEGMEAVLSDDDRFLLIPGSTRLGFYKNFERALELVSSSAELVALSDQDDRWQPDKLAALIDGLGDADLVYSDQRIVDRDGEIIAESYWSGERSQNHTNLTSLLISNTITGAASLFRRDLLEIALPFPEPPGTQYHDHWLALCALTGRGINYVDRPLYDYVQHEGAMLGHEQANRDLASSRVARRGGSRSPRLSRGGRAAYFHAYSRLRLLAETLLLRRGDDLKAGARGALRSFADAEDSPQSWGWLGIRDARRLLGRTETLGAERLILRGLAWRRAIGAAGLTRRLPTPRTGFHASLPETAVASAGDSRIGDRRARLLGGRIRPLELRVSESAPERINLLVPTVELKHFFGGYIAKFNLARRFSDRGRRVRILIIDATPPLPWSWQQEVEEYAGLAGLFDKVEIAFARDRDAPVEISPDDSFVATTWWTAHVAAAALKQTSRDRFLYLIQEYEPMTYPMGSEAALAASSYKLSHVALFSTEFMREYFAAHGHGVFADGEEQGYRDSICFQNAITRVEPPSVAGLSERTKRRLLFYARPEIHARRNMFELGLLGLSRAIENGVFGPEWRFTGIGAVDRSASIGLPDGRNLELRRKSGQQSYAGVLAGADVGLGLMCTPHPSLVPIEMASAGIVTVTNIFETKTATSLKALSANLIATDPSIEGVAAGLAEAVRRVDDHEARVAGAAVKWSRDWEDSFSDELIDAAIALFAPSI